MKIIVSGHRDLRDAEQVDITLSELKPTLIIHGGARGADNLAGQWAKEHGVPVRVYPANWGLYGKGAGPIRNQQMVDAGADYWVAFLAPTSRGTADFIRRAKAAGIPGQIVMVVT